MRRMIEPAFRHALITGAFGTVALGATAAPAFADVLGYYYDPPVTYYSYTYTEPVTPSAVPTQAPAGTTTTTTTTYSTAVPAPTPPPPPRVAVSPPSPGPQVVWVSGHWSFNGATWDWIPEHYEAAPQPTAQWTPGHWTRQAGGSWLWIAGR